MSGACDVCNRGDGLHCCMADVCQPRDAESEKSLFLHCQRRVDVEGPNGAHSQEAHYLAAIAQPRQPVLPPRLRTCGRVVCVFFFIFHFFFFFLGENADVGQDTLDMTSNIVTAASSAAATSASSNATTLKRAGPADAPKSGSKRGRGRAKPLFNNPRPTASTSTASTTPASALPTPSIMNQADATAAALAAHMQRSAEQRARTRGPDKEPRSSFSWVSLVVQQVGQQLQCRMCLTSLTSTHTTNQKAHVIRCSYGLAADLKANKANPEACRALVEAAVAESARKRLGQGSVDKIAVAAARTGADDQLCKVLQFLHAVYDNQSLNSADSPASQASHLVRFSQLPYSTAVMRATSDMVRPAFYKVLGEHFPAGSLAVLSFDGWTPTFKSAKVLGVCLSRVDWAQETVVTMPIALVPMFQLTETEDALKLVIDSALDRVAPGLLVFGAVSDAHSGTAAAADAYSGGSAVKCMAHQTSLALEAVAESEADYKRLIEAVRDVASNLSRRPALRARLANVASLVHLDKYASKYALRSDIAGRWHALVKLLDRYLSLTATFNADLGTFAQFLLKPDDLRDVIGLHALLSEVRDLTRPLERGGADASIASAPSLLHQLLMSLQRHADVRRSTPAVYGAAPSREAVIDQSPLTKRVAEAIHAECSRRFRFIYEVSYANAAAMFHPKHAALEHLSVLPPAERNQVQHGLYALVVNEVASNAQQRSMSLTAQDVQLVEASLIRLHQYAKDATDKNETPLRFWGDLKQARRPVNPTVASAFALGSCVIEGFFAYAPSTAYMERVFKTARQVDLTRFNLSDVNFEFNVLLQAYMRQLFPATSKDSATKIVAFAKKLIDLTH